MSIEDLKKFKPDSASELSFICSAFARLGAIMSGITLFSADKYWTLAIILMSWAGHEGAQYFKIDQNTENTIDKNTEKT